MASHGDCGSCNVRYSATADPWTLGRSAETEDARRYRDVPRSPFSYGLIGCFQQPYVSPHLDQRLGPFQGSVNPRLSYPCSDASVSTMWSLPPTTRAWEFPMTPPRLPMLQHTNIENVLSFNAPGEMERLLLISNLAEHVDHGFAAATAYSGVFTGFDPTSPATASPLLSSPEASSLLRAFEEAPLAHAADSSVRASVVTKSSENEEKTSPVRQHASTERAVALPDSQLAAASAKDLGQRPSTATTSRLGYGRRRKATPRKSPNADDPDFKGAVVEMQLLMIGGQPQLKMEHYYNDEQQRRSLGQYSSEPSDSEDDYEFVGEGKKCTSCATKSTPLWRAAEDGTQLCNACGIRYKKYKVRCTRCWHIPMKNENKRIYCLECGGLLLRFAARNSRP